MTLTVIFKLDSNESCQGCPLLNKGNWNDTWMCSLDFGSIPFEVNNVKRPRPISCMKYFEDHSTFVYGEKL